MFKQPVLARLVEPWVFREYPKYVVPHSSWITIKVPPEEPPSVFKPNVFDTLVRRLQVLYGEQKVVVDRKRRTIKVDPR